MATRSMQNEQAIDIPRPESGWTTVLLRRMDEAVVALNNRNPQLITRLMGFRGVLADAARQMDGDPDLSQTAVDRINRWDITWMIKLYPWLQDGVHDTRLRTENPAGTFLAKSQDVAHALARADALLREQPSNPLGHLWLSRVCHRVWQASTGEKAAREIRTQLGFVEETMPLDGRSDRDTALKMYLFHLAMAGTARETERDEVLNRMVVFDLTRTLFAEQKYREQFFPNALLLAWNPAHDYGNYFMAKLFYAVEDYQRALHHYLKALKTLTYAPTRSNASKRVASILRSMGRNKDALYYYHQAIAGK